VLKKRLTAIGLFLLILSLPFSSLAQDQAKTVTAIGVADGKHSRARDEALNDALRRAVEQGVGTFVSSVLSVEQQRLVEEKIYTESRGYIQSYRIVRESTQDGIYEVEVSAQVMMGKLAGDLESIGLLLQKKQNPRVMVVVYSREVDSSFMGVSLEGNRHVENQAESAFLAKGFQLVDAGQVQRKKELEAILLTGDPSRAGRMAGDFGAEILVEGEVRRSFVDERKIFGRSTRFFTNEVRFKALETDTAKVLFSGYRTRPPSGAGALLPLEEATSDLIDEMVAGILEQWRKDVYQAGTYYLDITGVSFEDLSKFKKGLADIRGVGDIRVRNFQGGRASVEVRYQGSLEELGDRIQAMRKPRPEIRGMQSNTIEMGLGK
jgi:hypothetical protein